MRVGSDGGAHYGPLLARIHHARFGAVARAAARELTGRLAASGIGSGTVVDLATGSGILARAALDAGFDVLAVDISEDMLDLARAQAGPATLVHDSLWSVPIPPCVAVAAVGEAFSYAIDARAGLSALSTRLDDIRGRLAPGGLLLFDVAAPGRSGPTGSRTAFWPLEGTYLGFEEHEDSTARRLTRVIHIFAPEEGRFRRTEETHMLRLYAPEEIGALLDGAGFTWERLGRYDQFELSPGWHAYAAVKEGR